MRNLKKFLALALSVMMVLSLFVTASAKSIDKDGKAQIFNDTTDVEFQRAIDVLNGMEVLKGDANPATGELTHNFRPNDKITRAEVAALVFRLSTGLTGTDAANHYAQYGNFSDVPKDAWYAGYVGYCANAGYVKGYDTFEGGRFGPSDYVTGYQATAMILRAMGWGVNGEFEGGNWALNVASIGTQTEILKEINSTHFGNATLYEYAPRQVVAQIFFKAATTGCVVYTPAFGYQTLQINGDSGASFDSLGYRYFGLTKDTRVILGNQATGESCTVLGPVWTAANNTPYVYPGSWTVDNNDHTKDVQNTAGLNLKVDTDLMWFGHKVDVYYNAKDTGAKQTYAIYDMATYKYVYSEDGNILSDGTSAKLGGLAESAKFAVDKYEGAHISDRFGWISTGKSPTAAQFTPIVGGDGYDPYLYNKGTATTSKVAEDDVADNVLGNDPLPYGTQYSSPNNATEAGSYYLLINNGTGLDVVITVAPELERITERNTTASVNTYRLSGKSDVVMGLSPIKPSTFGLADDGIIRKDSVTEGSDETLGHLVVGWEIKGTNYSVNYNNEIVKGDNKLYTYYLQPIAEKVTGTVKYYNGATGEVTLSTTSGDKTLKWTRLPVINEAVQPPLDGTNGNGGDGLPNAYFYNGEQYTFSIDPTDSSRYVDWTQGNDYEFLYTTYGDYDMGGLGSAELGYYVTGVNWNGEIVENKLVKTVSDGTNLLPLDGALYEALTITKKNLGGASNTSLGIGNEIQSGYYTGYGYNAGTNDLDVAKAGIIDNAGVTVNWQGHVQNPKYWDGKLVSDDNVNDPNYVAFGSSTDADNNGVWTIDKSNVADGWADQFSAGVGGLLLTPETKFIVVDGVGIKGSTNGLDVKIYNGISEFLNGSNDVRIDVKRFNAAGDQVPDYNVYYQLFDQEYNNYYKESNHLTYTQDNQMVKTVILPKAAVTWSDNTNLWFTNRNTYNGIFLAGQDAHGKIQQLTMWRNGEKQDVFVDTTKGSLFGNPISNVDTRYGMFFKLSESYKVGTTTIYQVDEMTAPALDNVYGSQNASTICNLDLQYEYTAVNGLNTARLRQLTTGSYNPTNAPSNQADVYNVTGANVTNLTSLNLGNIQQLSEAASVGYKITVSIVNDGHRVTQIYVTDVQAPGTWS